MSQFLSCLSQLTRSRLFRNMIFWLLILYILLNNDEEHYVYTPTSYYLYIAGTLTVLISLTAVNNLYLVPKQLAGKHYRNYLIQTILVVLAFAMVYVFLLKTRLWIFPKMEIHHISILHMPASDNWTPPVLLNELFWGFFSLVIWLMPMTMAWYAYDYNRKSKELDVYKRLQTESELAFLKSQISPHFLFNTLNNIYGLALKKSDATADSIIKLSSLMRYLLDESRRRVVSSDEELTMMRAYIELEMLRLNNSDHCTFSCTADGHYQLPGLLWLPLLENLFKHGASVLGEPLLLEYQFSIRNGVMCVCTKNRVKVNVQHQRIGTGIENLKKRLDLLYPDRHELTWSTQESMFYTKLVVDL